MANGRLAGASRQRKANGGSDRSLARKIEGIDKKMQSAIEKGDFVAAKELAEQQEKLLENLMLDQHGG
jgi:ribosome-binding protein aMBF1 (putative translation factor)